MKNLEINVVLVEPLYPLNIGSTSRAMSNMGADRLILINRQCDLDYSVQQAAATGQDAWRNAIEYKNWNEFFQGEPNGIRIALTARGGRIRSITTLEDTVKSLQNHPGIASGEFQKIYFIFGREDHGLGLEDIDQCHFACSLELFGKNTSLNLSQAVLLTLFVFQKIRGQSPTPVQNHQDAPKQHASNRLSDTVLQQWLETLGFDISDRRVSAFTVLKRVLFHNVPTADELRILEAILEQTVRKLKSSK